MEYKFPNSTILGQPHMHDSSSLLLACSMRIICRSLYKHSQQNLITICPTKRKQLHFVWDANPGQAIPPTTYMHFTSVATSNLAAQKPGTSSQIQQVRSVHSTSGAAGVKLMSRPT